MSLSSRKRGGEYRAENPQFPDVETLADFNDFVDIELYQFHSAESFLAGGVTATAHAGG